MARIAQGKEVLQQAMALLFSARTAKELRQAQAVVLPIRVMFQDEARFGRISDTRRCWCPAPTRPVCRSMVTQEYTYAYAAASPDGILDSLILPHVNSDCMQIFLDEVAYDTGMNESSWSLTVPDGILQGYLPFRRI